MRRKYLFALAFLPFLMAAGPLYLHKEPEVQREFQNIYDDLKGFNHFYAQAGTALKPAYTFLVDNSVGIYAYASGGYGIAFVTGGTDRLLVGLTGIAIKNVSSFYPDADNSAALGANLHRWTAVWAANGTIQTSMSRNKRNISDLDLSDPRNSVPRGVKFQWKDKEGKPDDDTYIGFIADSLPPESHPKLKDGTTDPDNVYTSAVIGILCAKVQELDSRVQKLEKK